MAAHRPSAIQTAHEAAGHALNTPLRAVTFHISYLAFCTANTFHVSHLRTGWLACPPPPRPRPPVARSAATRTDPTCPLECLGDRCPPLGNPDRPHRIDGRAQPGHGSWRRTERAADLDSAKPRRFGEAIIQCVRPSMVPACLSSKIHWYF